MTARQYLDLEPESDIVRMPAQQPKRSMEILIAEVENGYQIGYQTSRLDRYWVARDIQHVGALLPAIVETYRRDDARYQRCLEFAPTMLDMLRRIVNVNGDSPIVPSKLTAKVRSLLATIDERRGG